MSEKDQKIIPRQDLLDITELINPFPGLRPFGVEESHLFFGREGQSDEVLQKLSDNRFAAILGASGSGKSSFMYCGLIPTLHGGFMTDAGSNWKIITMRPGGGPIDNLADSMLQKDINYNSLSEENKLIKKTIIGTVLRSSSLGLVEVIKQLRTDDFQNVLILVDQFEELFRFARVEATSSEQDESSAFVNLLLEAIHQLDEPIYVALTMRSDFIGECARYPDLTQMINDSHYLIPQMTRDQKRNAIEGPVAVGGGEIAPRLTQQLLNDVGDNPDQLPILQHALMRTWSYWVENRKEGEPMDLRHYNAIGTLREALSQHANEAYDGLNKREKEICEIMFKALTERGSENQGIRRPTKLGTIAAIAGVSEDEVERIVDRFREPGRSLLMPPYGVRLTTDSVIDISHESLMRIWDRLKKWLDEESKAAEMYLKLSEAAERFQEGKASLWKMPDLQLALNWREENKPTLVWGQRYNPAFERTMVFLDTSEKAYETEQRNKELLQKRKVRAMRITAAVLGLAALICLFLVFLAQIKADQASAAEAEALINLEKAQVQEQKANEQAAIAREAENDAEERRLEALRALDQAEKARADAETQRRAAVQSAEEARLAKIDADEQRDAAREAEQEALKNEQAALEARAAADSARLAAERLRYQAIAQSMAIKAKSVPDVDLKGLVAKQGYDFYIEYKDPSKAYNGDVYSGVYYGLQGLLTKKYNEFDSDKAKELADSTLNQYHGHISISENEEEQQVVPVRSVAYSSDGKRMYSAGGDGRLLAWDVDTREFTELYRSQNVGRVVNISPNERWLALGSDLQEIFLFDLQNPEKEPRRLASHKGAIFDLVFLPDNTGFVSVGADRKVLFSDFESTREIAQVSSFIKSLAIAPDSKTLAGGATNGDIFIWDISKEENNQTEIYREEREKLSESKKQPVEALSFSNDGKYLAIGGFLQSEIRSEDGSGYVIIWDMKNKQQFGPDLGGFTSPVTDVEFNKTDQLLAASSRDATARFWDLENIYDLPTILDDHNDWVLDLAFHPDGDGLMTASYDGLIRYFPTKPDGYVQRICPLLERNMSDVEWRQFVADPNDIAWQETCEGLPKPLNQ